jgi:2-isopropylmalate synthase
VIGGALRNESFKDVKTPKLTLVAFRAVTTGRRSWAEVTILREDGGHVEAEAEGDGSVDAIFRAVDAALAVRGKFTGLRIHAFADYGTVGKASVRVDFGGREYAGRGSSPDPLEAAACGYLSAASSYLAQRAPRTSLR